MFNGVLRSSLFMLCCAFAASAQAQPFSALVVDAQGQPVAGAVLSLAGTAQVKPRAAAVMDQ
ncbi:MAG TPA: hypothetical protein DCX38_02045, partial [Pseudomonas sp.]|nr:hypothetical protein [Pseudomonas sp.]